MSATATVGLAAGSAKPGPPLPMDPSRLLRTVQGHVEDIRSLIYCGICVKPLYEPFTLACGHTFCYSCLTQWFVNHKRKKTCPDCRASVSAQPAPAYLIREIVQMFISRAELLEGDETTKEHLSNKLAETEKMESDKSNKDPVNGGLFQGCFKCPLPFNEPINDILDGVTRCPRCAWELEEGECHHCGFSAVGYSSGGSHSDSDLSGEDGSITMTDALDEIEDGFSGIDTDDIAWNELYGDFEYPVHQHQQNVVSNASDLSSMNHRSDYSDDEDSHDSEMSDFIDDGPIEEEAIETDRSTVVGGNTIISDSDSDMQSQIVAAPAVSRAPCPRQPIPFGDDDGDEEHDYGNNDYQREIAGNINNIDDDDYDDEGDDDDDEPVRAPTRTVQQRRQIFSYSINSASRLRNRATTASTRTSVLDSDDEEDGEGGSVLLNLSTRAHASGSNAHSAISLDDDSDVPFAPTRSQRRGPRPGQIRPSQRRDRRRGQGTNSPG
ncbi:hypothetical protein ACJ73_05092 [Blastomyces percursus]|uniref:RING-type domain-containing protein n=1 Tax=Blastomyces percursus TaxID=1658174 RepID=A0A1J9Q4F1_9EURO|nr:hypothetical protein ACJ73_05092 [Blastomyces percursus]